KEIQKYSHLENRDIWEYDLNLSKSQIDWIIAHLWELKDIDIDYYFTDENCSFRLLELIRVALPEKHLLDHMRLTELPVDTVRTLQKHKLITGRHYRPSKLTELHQYSDQLTGGEKQLARHLADQPDLMDSSAF